MAWSKWHTFSELTVGRAPKQIGVYEFSLDGETIYYGMTQEKEGLFGRLKDHWTKDEKENPCLYRAFRKGAQVRWETHLSPDAREKDLMRNYQKAHGEYPRCNRNVPGGADSEE
jgi:hypothetical protein